MNLTHRDFEEKRNFIRMRVDAAVTLSSRTGGNELNGICKNLSGGGMLIELNSTVPVGDIVEVCIASGHGHNPMLKARAEVTRVSSRLGNENKPCLVGMEIIEMLQ